jgi:hypothetical protein
MRFFFLTGLLFLTGCGQTSGLNLGHYPDPNASPEEFIYCHGYSCSQKTLFGFREGEWKDIQKIFKKKSKTAKEEREKIGDAIAKMEQVIGVTIGTDEDLPKAPIKKQSDNELDCIDETVNTTKLLKFLENDGLLKFHTVGEPVYKGLFINGVYPHNSATVKEIETGHIYVVDSYIYKNGAPPNIRGLDNWLQYRVEDLEKAHNQTTATAEQIIR